MIPICLVTGFLGSGKTTFLQHLIATQNGARRVYLVNEFNPVDVDGARLELPEGELVSVAGGSIFCKCKVTEFIGALNQIAEQAGVLGGIEGVVIEASGMANPRVLQSMLAETGLAKTYHLSRVIALTDPKRLPKLLQTLPNTREQIAAADVVLVNRCDKHSPDLIQAAVEQIRTINPRATVHETIRAAIDLDLFGRTSAAAAGGEYALCRDPNYATLTATPAQTLELEHLDAVLAELGDDLYRAKGRVALAAGAFDVDYTDGTWEAKPATDTGGELVLIVAGAAQRKAEMLIKKIENGTVSC